MFNHKSKLTAWIITAALTISALSATVYGADALPSIGAGSSINVAAADVMAEADIIKKAVSDYSRVRTTVFPSAGVEAAAGGIASISVIITDEPETVKGTDAQDELDEIVTDLAVAAPQEAARGLQDASDEVPVQDETTELSTSITVPSDIADSGIAGQVEDTSDDDAQISVSGNSVAKGSTVSGQDAAARNAREMYSNLVIAKCNDYVNVRKEPSEDAEILGKLYNESVGDFVSEADGGWYEIISGTVRGYVKAEYVVTGEAAVERAKEVGKRLAKVNTTTLYVRENPSTDSSVIGMVAIDDDLTVLEEAEEGWAKVSVEEGDGYVSTDYVTLKTEFVKAESKEEEAARLAKERAEREAAAKRAEQAARKGSKKKGSGSSGGGSYAAPSGGNGSAVANYALQFVGNPYVYGGSSLTNGTDCSGFTMSVYAAFGVGLPHSSGAQRSCGTDVGGLANAQPGDIVCYSGHVGIYIGGGQIVHASTAKTGIKVSNAGYRNVLSVRRIL